MSIILSTVGCVLCVSVPPGREATSHHYTQTIFSRHKGRKIDEGTTDVMINRLIQASKKKHAYSIIVFFVAIIVCKSSIAWPRSVFLSSIEVGWTWTGQWPVGVSVTYCILLAHRFDHRGWRLLKSSQRQQCLPYGINTTYNKQQNEDIRIDWFIQRETKIHPRAVPSFGIGNFQVEWMNQAKAAQRFERAHNITAQLHSSDKCVNIHLQVHEHVCSMCTFNGLQKCKLANFRSYGAQS